jgi:HAD superfamily hydrolase (TIGR01450 family)
MSAPAIADTTAWVIDVDGCLMRTARAGGAGGEPFPLAAELLASLKAAGHRVLVCTNASQRTPAQYATHLRSVGLDIADDELVTAGSAAADYIAAHHPGATVLAVGAEGLAEPLRACGLSVIDPADHAIADVVVVGAADGYSTALINAACVAVDAGAPLYATVVEPWFHGGVGKSVAMSAAMAHAIGWTTGVTPRVLGKPSPALAETLLSRLGGTPDSVAVVGDATVEIELARLMGARSVLVLSGATSVAQLDALRGRDRPDLALADVTELFHVLFSEPITHTTHDKGVQS